MSTIQTHMDGAHMQLPLSELNGNGTVDQVHDRLKTTGIKMINEGRGREAAQVLQALCGQFPGDGPAQSYLGLALAMSQKGNKGLELCREAAENNPFHAEIHHNLGRVYLMAGRRQMAWKIFVLAARLDGDSREIKDDLENMGKRRPPVIPALDRSHPVNVWAGRVLTKVGLR